MKKQQSLGKHILVEAYDCDRERLDNLSGLQAAMQTAAEVAGATVVDVAFRKFEPYGISGVVIISESHLTIHTWPEHGYAAIDLFTCGCRAEPWKAFDFLSGFLKASKVTTMEVQRGYVETGEASQKSLNQIQAAR